MNFYAVLGIPRDADEETIRNAYRILARQYHPDRGAGSSADKFRQVTEAYETLTDRGSRHAYDLTLQWAERRAPIRVEPMVARSGLFRQEDASVFGRFEQAARFEHAPHGVGFPRLHGFDVWFDQWFDSLDDWFEQEKRC